MRLACSLLALLGCATADAIPPEQPPRDLLEEAWSETLRAGDVVIGVPGTGGYSTLGVHIEAAIDPANPESFFDASKFRSAAQVTEQAIAAAQRAGFSDAQIEAGEIRLAIWGAGITELSQFRYLSVGGLDVTFDVIGGTSVCASGSIFENLVNYNADNAAKDAGDLYRRTKQFLQDGEPAGRNVVLVGHSWGGLVAEYATAHFAGFEHANGEWNASLAFTIAGGVPGMVPGFASFGPGFRTITSEAGERTANVRTLEVDRPDDPIRTLDPNGNGAGHDYVIMNGDDYVGWYGITTDNLACDGVPGACPHP